MTDETVDYEYECNECGASPAGWLRDGCIAVLCAKCEAAHKCEDYAVPDVCAELLRRARAKR